MHEQMPPRLLPPRPLVPDPPFSGATGRPMRLSSSRWLGWVRLLFVQLAWRWTFEGSLAWPTVLRRKSWSGLWNGSNSVCRGSDTVRLPVHPLPPSWGAEKLVPFSGEFLEVPSCTLLS
mmetsp:Transcript_77700/g.218074  ORF Transcript_77700/g.218074 Transcript_77700/m.218074 type:complete len:119 (+) Transcript_77700:140-496(+)